MKIVERRIALIEAGDARLEFELDIETGAPITVANEHDGEVTSVEWIERYAEACRRVRFRRGDARKVCPDHGYYEARAEVDEFDRCPVCADNQKAAGTVEMLKRAEKIT